MAGGGRVELEARLRADGLDPGSWGNGPGDRYAVHRHAYDKVIVVIEGSIAFGLPGLGGSGGSGGSVGSGGSGGSGGSVGLVMGDRLELPAGTDHDATVGPAGVSCLEAHLPAGTLRAARRVPAGDW